MRLIIAIAILLIDLSSFAQSWKSDGNKQLDSILYIAIDESELHKYYFEGYAYNSDHSVKYHDRRYDFEPRIYRSVYTYYTDTLIKSVVAQVGFPGMADSLFNDDGKADYYYHSNGKLKDIIISYSEYDWSKDKIHFEYFNPGQSHYRIYFDLNFGEWQQYSRDSIIVNELGFVLARYRQRWNGYFYNHDAYVNTYDANGRKTSRIYLISPAPYEKLDSVYRIQYYYNPQSQVDSLKRQRWNAGVWTTEIFRWDYTYDQDGDLLSITTSYLDTVGRVSVDSVSYVYSYTTGIREENNFSYVRVFPNPTIGRITLESSEKIFEIELLNTNGELVQSFRQTNLAELQIDNELDNGIYILKIRLDTGIETKKIVLNR